MAISSLIIVRFSKFKIWYTQGSKPVLSNMSMITRATVRARSRRARDDVILQIMNEKLMQLQRGAVRDTFIT